MNTNWEPSASLVALQARAAVLAKIRRFFSQRGVLEVETPSLAKYTVTAPHIASFRTQQGGQYLQTSPEYAMKRLLAFGSGDIYQVCKVFRQAERGTKHNSEFSMLEWYRVAMPYQVLAEEASQLIQVCLHQTEGELLVEQYAYRDVFMQFADIDPFTADESQLKEVAQQYIEFYFDGLSRDDYLDLLFTHCIEPHLGVGDNGEKTICVLSDFPASQAALSEVVSTSYGDVGQRFEIFVAGVELANGYQELRDADELKRRWQRDNAYRMQANLDSVALDEYLLLAQDSGLPACSGVAIGIDRLLMLMLNESDIEAVIAFCDDRA